MADATNVPGYVGFVSDANIQSISIPIADPGADDVIAAYRFPVKGRVRGAYVIPRATLAGGTDNYYSVNLLNGGTAGTATTSVSGTAGGTGGWTADTPVTISITSPALGTFTAGQWVQINYDETGTVAPNFTVQLDVDLYPVS
jgi:hypothetical protein